MKPEISFLFIIYGAGTVNLSSTLKPPLLIFAEKFSVLSLNGILVITEMLTWIGRPR